MPAVTARAADRFHARSDVATSGLPSRAWPYTPPMTDAPDARLIELTPDARLRPLPAALVAARAAIVAGARDVLATPADGLERPWPWRDAPDVERRYGAYRAAEALEVAELEARSLLAAGDADEPLAARLAGPMTAARWELEGLLLPLDDTLLDADPGGGEWTLRLVLGHIVGGQRAYAWSAAWIAAHPDGAATPGGPVRVPETFWDDIPDEATTEAEGSLDAIRARFDSIVDASAERLAATPDALMAIPTRWSGADVTLAFRFERCASHIREHTIQVEKTLALLGAVPDEPARLVRHVLATYGRAEAAVFGRTAVEAAAERLALAAAEGRAAMGAAREAAGT